MRTVEINGQVLEIEHPYAGCVQVGSTMLSLGAYLSTQELADLEKDPLRYYRALQGLEDQAILRERRCCIGHADE